MTAVEEGNAPAPLARVRDVASARDGGPGTGPGDVAVAVAAPPRWRRAWAALTAPLAGTGKDAGRKVGASAAWTGRPPSLAELYRYIDDGDWVPGERAPVLERLRRAFGFCIVIPVHAAAYAVLWVLARPARLLIAAALFGAFRLALALG